MANDVSTSNTDQEPQAYDASYEIVRFALVTRVAIMSLALLSRLVVPAHDTSSDLLFPELTSGTTLQRIAAFAVITFVRWDAVYFLHISQEGYVFEQEFAFFPLLPWSMRALSKSVLSPLHLLFSDKIVLAISGLTISNTSFILAALLLYRTSQIVLKSEHHARLAGLLFCCPPASIFMSSIYTESPFCFLFFAGTYLFAKSQRFAAAVVWALATLTRSNGILSAGFFIFDWIQQSLHRQSTPTVHCIRTLKTVLYSLITVAPFVLVQHMGFSKFCKVVPTRPYCLSWRHSIYSFVQDHYWNVGFWRYYTVSQIPNFALAFPLASFSVYGVWKYAQQAPLRFASLGLLRWASSVYSSDDADSSNVVFATKLMPFIYLWALLLVYCMTVMHVQVILRFFSFLPPLYWFAADIILENHYGRNRYPSWIASAIIHYLVIYGAIGAVLFSAFYPPA